MLIASGLALLNLLLLRLLFHETHQTDLSKKFSLAAAFHLFVSAFRHERIRYLCIVFLIYIWGWSNYYSFIYVYLVKFYHYSAMKSSLFSAFMGLGFCLGSGYLTGRLNRFSSKRVAIIGILVAGLGCLLTLLLTSEIYLWLFAFIIGTAVSVSYPNILTMFSQQVSDEEQGWVMGVNGSMMALSFGLSTLASGYLVSVNESLPLWIAAAGMLLSCFLLLFVKVRLNKGAV